MKSLTGIDPSESFLAKARARLGNKAAFGKANLAAIQVVTIDITTRFRNFEEYWTPFPGGQGPAPAYAMSLDETSCLAYESVTAARVPEGSWRRLIEDQLRQHGVAFELY